MNTIKEKFEDWLKNKSGFIDEENAFKAGYECRDNELATPAGIVELRNRLEDAEKALKFYADKENNESDICMPESVVANDNGKVAQEYFEKYKGRE